MDLQVKFKAPVTKVETVIAAGLAERTFPFVLTRGGTAGAAQATSVQPGKPEAQAPAAKPAAAAEDRMADQPKAAAARKPAAPSHPGSEAQAAPARKPAPEQATKPVPPPAPRCVIKPVMTDAEIDICRNDRTPGMSSSGNAGAIAAPRPPR